MHAWTDDAKPLRLVEQDVPKGDSDPKALACYELLVRWVVGNQHNWDTSVKTLNIHLKY